MVVCSFYQQGNCRFGANCKNEHPRGAQPAFGANTNRFAPLSGGGDRYRPAQQQQQQQSNAFGAGRDTKTPKFHLDSKEIKDDLTTQRPIYPLSCYGPGRSAPRQLIEGPVEISPEELRWRYYMQKASGNEPGARSEETELAAKMQQQVDSVVKDLNGAIRYIEDGENIHPNRIDIAQGKANSATPAGPASSNPFAKPPVNPLGGAQTTSAFGQPSAPGFAQPRLGSAFGQPSNPGRPSTAFGQPSSPGQNASPFGQTNALGGQGTFGKPSMPGAGAFGQPSMPGQTGTPFGQTTALGGQGTFGKPSMPGGGVFGQPSNPGQTATPFGQSTAPAAFGKPTFPGGATFGQPSAPALKPAFGQPSAPVTSTFGQPSAPATGTTFGQPSAPGAASPFGKPSTPGTTSTFGQPTAPAAASVFGRPAAPGTTSTFGQPSPFGGQQQNQTQPSPFGQQPPASKPSPFPSAPTQAANPFAQKMQSPAAPPSPFGQQTQSPKPLGQPQATAGTGKPIDPKDRFKEGKPEDYEGDQGKILEEIYRRVGELGRFEDDEDIPLVPPKCEWIVALQT